AAEAIHHVSIKRRQLSPYCEAAEQSMLVLLVRPYEVGLTRARGGFPLATASISEPTRPMSQSRRSVNALNTPRTAFARRRASRPVENSTTAVRRRCASLCRNAAQRDKAAASICRIACDVISVSLENLSVRPRQAREVHAHEGQDAAGGASDG